MWSLHTMYFHICTFDVNQKWHFDFGISMIGGHRRTRSKILHFLRSLTKTCLFFKSLIWILQLLFPLGWNRINRMPRIYFVFVKCKVLVVYINISLKIHIPTLCYGEKKCPCAWGFLKRNLIWTMISEKNHYNFLL